MAGLGKKIKNYLGGSLGWALPSSIAKPLNAQHIGRYISPITFERLKVDIQGWKDAVTEAESVIYPYRVKMQRIFLNVVQHGHVAACLERRRNLILLKDFALYNGDKIDEKSTELLRANWFYEMLGHTIDAKFYGYTLMEMGDLVNNTFPNLTLVRRENVSPDRLIVSNMVYNPAGLEFQNPDLKDANGQSYCDWTLYIDTPTERGTNMSPCGYGLLYKVALYDIFLTNLLGFNADYVELFAQPYRVGKTTKFEGAEYDQLQKAMVEMGSSGYAIIDQMDSIEFLNTSGNGVGFKSYGDFEARLEDKITKLLLGHEDALKSTPGKLGSEQGGENSAVARALTEIEKLDARWLEYKLNDVILPKLQNVGLPIAKGLRFKFKNDKEQAEIKEAFNANAKEVTDYIKTLHDAGLKADINWVSEQSGIPLSELAPETPNQISDKVKSINNLYNAE